MPQNRISICTSCSVGSRRAIVVPSERRCRAGGGVSFRFVHELCSLVLFVADLFHPVDHFAVELFLNGDVGHRRGWRGAVPMLLAGRNPDHVARPDFLDRAAPTLRPAATGRHDQGLAERMCVPCRPRAGLEGDAGAERARRSGRIEQRIDAHRAGEPIRRSLAGRL